MYLFILDRPVFELAKFEDFVILRKYCIIADNRLMKIVKSNIVNIYFYELVQGKITLNHGSCAHESPI